MSGADTASIYLPAPPGAPSAAILLHEGEIPAIPELQDPVTTETLLAAFEPGRGGEVHPTFQIAESRRPGGWLLQVAAESWQAASGGSKRLERRLTDRRRTAESPLWIGLRYPADDARPGSGSALSAAVRGEGGERWLHILSLGRILALHSRRVDAVLCDPVTDLPGRADFQAALGQATERVHLEGEDLALLLVNPDDFQRVNERFGRSAGDEVMREIAGRLSSSLRRSDLIHRYGGAVFAVLLPDTAPDIVARVAEKLHADLTAAPYHRGSLRLAFNLGSAAFDPAASATAEQAALDLVRRADQALAGARRAENGPIVGWQPAIATEVTELGDRLSGIFTADAAKDYRNMLLLWDTLDLIAGSVDPDELAARVVDRLDAAFKPDRIGFFALAEGGEPELLKGHARQDTPPLFDQAERALIARAGSAKRVIVEQLAAGGHGYAAPLTSRGTTLGCLYFAGRHDGLRLDASDLVFVEALSAQLSGALDRLFLIADERRRQEQERSRLEAELSGLRRATRKARLVYRSPQMTALLDTVRRVAPTDATVLVTGASGTGKELVALTLHELSGRSSKPPVVVDCGAISETLIDSELFGHERGAYTGADRRTVGRLTEAEGSTLILDEIGELPLAVQAKLLRFVQEKEIIPVGGVRPRRLDVRLVAVTNRDLATEAAAGRFREDLYHRLNVLQIEVPRLAARPDDIPLLVEHFLTAFSRRYGKAIRGLDTEAETLVRTYPWSGNVRELRNRLLRAVILSEGDEIGPRELGLEARALGGGTRGSDLLTDPDGESPSAPPSGLFSFPPLPPREPDPGTQRPAAAEAWDGLRRELRRQVEDAVRGGSTPPLGRWLATDLVLAAQSSGGGVASRGAAILGVAETTYRRRLAKAEGTGGDARRPPAREALRRHLARLCRADHPPGADLPAHARRLLLAEVMAVLPRNAAAGAALMGVSAPTFRRLRRRAESDGEPGAAASPPDREREETA